MHIQHNLSLKSYNTFGIDVNTRYFAEYSSIGELKEILGSEIIYANPWLHIGGGSNLLFLKDFEGIILHSQLKSIEKISETNEIVLLKVGAGMVWDDFVAYCVENNYYGVENLSLIPGEVGASAVQNIGAYGMEVKDTIEKVEFMDIKTLKPDIFTNPDCKYSYRKSIFKEELKGKVIVTHVLFRLRKKADFILNYSNLKDAVLKHGEINLSNIRETVIEIRRNKLPDPKELGNAGSFFMNPVIPKTQFEELLHSYPAMPHYPVSETEVKVPAGWLIEQCDLKGKQFERVGIYHKQALVIVNLGGATGQDIATVASLIQITVKKRFGIEIIPEVNYIS